MIRSALTFEVVTRECDYCGEDLPVRLIDGGGYISDNLICEDCFSHDEMSWDDLPEAKFPKEE